MPTVPREGLAAVRQVWGGPGWLWTALAEGAAPEWSPDLARRRAARVALEIARPHLLAWPPSLRHWVDALPAESRRDTHRSDFHAGAVDWVSTRIGGWPPRTFVSRNRERMADSLLVATLKWTLDEVIALSDEVKAAVPGVVVELAPVLAAASAVRETPLVAAASPTAPTKSDLALVRTSGRPWASVAAVARTLRDLHSDPARLVELAIEPDPALADRVFHLSVFGLVLRGIEAAGWTWRPARVLGMGGSGPAVYATAPSGDVWELWFETSGSWSHHGLKEPFPRAVAGIAGTGGPLGADIGLIRPGGRGLVFECKFSDDPTYVGRAGYEQLLAYMTEARTVLLDEVAGLLVGPDEVVTTPGRASTYAGDVDVVGASGVVDFIAGWVQGASVAAA